MLALILDTAKADERIRAVIMNGSRANPNAPRDNFQDFDIVFLVDDPAAFRGDPAWFDRFGDRMILQFPEDMGDIAPDPHAAFSCLMQFMDGNRIDLWLYPLAEYKTKPRDSLSLLLLDKDGSLGLFEPAGERDYLPKPPTAKQFSDCCNEFWWVCPYAAKGLWRGEMTYARSMLDQAVREQLMKMLTWHIGIRTDYQANPGKFGKYFQKFLEPEWWQMLMETYADHRPESAWDALFRMGDLFRMAARDIADHYGFAYPEEDDRRVSRHLRHVQMLPRDAREMYPGNGDSLQGEARDGDG
jgi:aminoglycoside 6-adenylyltransferase